MFLYHHHVSWEAGVTTSTATKTVCYILSIIHYLEVSRNEIIICTTLYEDDLKVSHYFTGYIILRLCKLVKYILLSSPRASEYWGTHIYGCFFFNHNISLQRSLKKENKHALHACLRMASSLKVSHSFAGLMNPRNCRLLEMISLYFVIINVCLDMFGHIYFQFLQLIVLMWWRL